MEAWTFFKIDLKRNWKSILSIISMDILYACMSHADPFYFIVMMILWSVTWACMPFDKERREESRFLYMLPATKQSRVVGRYLMAFVFSLASMMGYFIGKILIYRLLYNNAEKIDGSTVMILSVTLFMISMTYMIVYEIGKTGIERLDRILPVIIAAVLMIGPLWIIPDTLYYSILYDWMPQHMQVSAIFSLVFSIGMWMIGIVVSGKILEKKDFV